MTCVHMKEARFIQNCIFRLIKRKHCLKLGHEHNQFWVPNSYKIMALADLCVQTQLLFADWKRGNKFLSSLTQSVSQCSINQPLK